MASRSKKKDVYRKEQQDAKCISRKKWNYTMSFKMFLIIKIILILLIPIIYFVYSPLLVVLMLLYVGVFFLARLTERSMNTSVIKTNRIHIPKFDSALALVLIVVAICGILIEMDSSTKFADFGALLTGQRNPLEKVFKFIKVNNLPPSIETDQKGSAEFDIYDLLDKLPIKFVASTTLSTMCTVLVFSIAGVSALSLLYIYFKCKKFNRIMNAVVYDEAPILTDKTLNEILSFGESVDNTVVSEEEINRKINAVKQSDAVEESNLTTIEKNAADEPEEDIEILNL